MATFGRQKSELTKMLAEGGAETQCCHDIFAAVPRKAKQETEATPISTVDVPRGLDFWIYVIILALVTAAAIYTCTVGISVVFAFANMAGGSCGQEVWGDNETACNQLIINAFALGTELRCARQKPEFMLEEDFEEACGSGAVVGMVVGLCVAFGFGGKALYDEIGKIPSKVNFYETLFTVESWNGEFFRCSFYVDVTGTSNSRWTGLEISTKARVSLAAGGEDEKDKKGKTLVIKGDGKITLLSGDGQAQQDFLMAFARHLPVSIAGLEGGPAPQSSSASGILDGHLGKLLTARKADNGEQPEYDAAHRPFTCDLVIEVIFVCVLCLMAWYLFTCVEKVIGWAIKKGTNKCLDPMKPGEDMCAVWRIFVPIAVPLVNPGDWLGLLVVFCFLGAGFFHYITTLPMEHRFHRSGVLQEILWAGWETQENTMVFSSDIEALEEVESWGGNHIKATVRASYSAQGGTMKPFKVRARFVAADLKLALVDASCAACSGHAEAAASHRQKLLGLLHEFKPGTLRSDEVIGAASGFSSTAPGMDSVVNVVCGQKSEVSTQTKEESGTRSRWAASLEAGIAWRPKDWPQTLPCE